MGLTPGKPWKEYDYEHADAHPIIGVCSGRMVAECSAKSVILHMKTADGELEINLTPDQVVSDLSSIVCLYRSWQQWHDHAVEKKARAMVERQVRLEMDSEIKRRTQELKQLIEDGIDAKLNGKSAKTDHKASGQRDLVLK